ncbi:SBBP repeat-containing protein [candidate division KSB1 bacterium]|nr:SBBP repeat-containing protein [candidate division KSB1 bacterium]MBL7112535.1 SBBP repeat-containing protein [Bacteroidales bacterium]
MENNTLRKNKIILTFTINILFFLICLFLSDGTHKHTLKVAPESQPGKTYNRQVRCLKTMPLRFEKNMGQTAESVQFISHGLDYTLFLTPNQSVFSLQHCAKKNLNTTLKKTSIRMTIEDANPDAEITGINEQDCKTNYFIGSDATNWRTNIPNYEKIIYKEIYDGIDLVYHGTKGKLEYDFIVKPGADPNKIALNFDGEEEQRFDEQGNLILKTELGDVSFLEPMIYQEIDGDRQMIPGNYCWDSNNRVTFQVEEYDKTETLVIDPMVIFATYVGGSESDYIQNIAVDPAGAIYITGNSSSPDFPGTYDMTGGNSTAFVAKIDPDNAKYEYITFIGGTGQYTYASAYGLDVDPAGNAYVAGYIGGSEGARDFPTVNAYQESAGGNTDAYLLKLNPTGDSILYATYFGGGDHEGDAGNTMGVGVDGFGHVVIGGNTTPSIGGDPFPIRNAFQPNLGYYGYTGFVAKFDPSKSGDESLLYSTYIASEGDTEVLDVAADAVGHAYITGYAEAEGLPVVNAFQDNIAGDADAFVIKLTPGGKDAVYSTYLGGPAPDKRDTGRGIAADVSGYAYVTGSPADGFPLTPGAFQTSGWGGFITCFDPTGNLEYSTLYPYAGYGGIDVDLKGRAFVGLYGAD